MKLFQNTENKLEVRTTKDYSLFKSLNGNRDVNGLHLKRIIKSFSENPLLSIITVNENYQIIDGQHRFLALKELDMPINYIMVNGYGLREVQVLNANTKNWTSQDYLDGYCDMGIESYKEFKKFQEKYKFTNSICIILLLGSNSGTKNYNNFKDGNFKIQNLTKSYNVADTLYKIKDYYEGYNRKSFVCAMMTLFNKDNFNIDMFFDKLEKQPTALKDCINTSQYLELIESIYNYRNKNKVNLRF